jgi:hypothetical protein
MLGCGGPWWRRAAKSCATPAEKPDGNPCPSVDGRRCRSMIGRTAGTVSSTEPVGPRTTEGDASSGSSSPTGSSSRSVPSPTNVRATAAVIAFVSDAIRNSESASIGRPPTDWLPSTTTPRSSPRPTMATSPGTCPDSTSGRNRSASPAMESACHSTPAPTRRRVRPGQVRVCPERSRRRRRSRCRRRAARSGAALRRRGLGSGGRATWAATRLGRRAVP